MDEDETVGLSIEVDDEAEEVDESIEDEGPAVFDAKSKYSKLELEEWADKMLREDANRELCRVCRTKNPDSLPYGEETGHVEHKMETDKEGDYILDEEGNPLVIAYPELKCAKGHKWYLGEGPRRDIRGQNPILFEPHLYNRRRRELLAAEGVVDPAYTMDRWGKRPTTGLYMRSHPLGRKTNTPEQRKAHGAGFYKRCYSKLEGTVSVSGDGIFHDHSRTNKASQKTRSQTTTGDGAALGISPMWW